MFKITKNSPIQGGCWICRIHEEDLTRLGEGKFQGGLRPLSELSIRHLVHKPGR